MRELLVFVGVDDQGSEFRLEFPPLGVSVGSPRYAKPVFEDAPYLVFSRPADPIDVPKEASGFFFIVTSDVQEYLAYREDLIAPFEPFYEGGLLHCRQFAVQAAISRHQKSYLRAAFDRLIKGYATPDAYLAGYRDWLSKQARP
jgi:hypothetical protein